MYTIDEVFEFKQIIKKSTFICTLIPVNSVEEANSHLKEIRKKYYDATHNCYSYIINQNGTVQIKSSDDGEPSKTAGVIILDVLQKQQLTNILAIVTRYFGGIKLGAGGLVRAYSSSTSEALKIANIKEIIEKEIISIIINYNYVNDILKLFKDQELISTSYEENVTLSFNVSKLDKEKLITDTINITKNSATIK